MLMQSVFSRTSTNGLSDRIFVYEVSGLAENDQTTDQVHSIRSSASQFYQVPFSRMNQAMNQFIRMGGKIISIQPLGAEAPALAVASAESEEA
jgi:sulfite reductase alpha subunit-like flavoprotein